MEQEWKKEDFLWDDDLKRKLDETDDYKHNDYDHYLYHIGYRQAMKDFINKVIRHHEDRDQEHKEG